MQVFQNVKQTEDVSGDPQLTTWSRLEALPVNADIGPALQAQVADPLWLLTRQWQFGELQGEDAGSPIVVHLAGERARLHRYLAGSLDNDPAQRAIDYEHLDVPLEVMVEREDARAASPRMAAAAGLEFRRLLALRGKQEYFAAFAAAYPLAIEVADAAADRPGLQWAMLVRDRALDGRKLAEALGQHAPASEDGPVTGLPLDLQGTVEDIVGVRQAAGDWLRWYDAAVSEEHDNPAWNPHRMEYALALSATLGAGPAVLVADEYTDGELDWYSFRAADGPSLGGAPRDPEPLELRPRLAVPASYPGMPADRFWAFEDASVNLGGLETAPTDLARLLLVEFALIYGNDWFVVPVELPVGALCSLTALTVTDTFGVTAQVQPTRKADDSDWRMFQLSTRGAPSYLEDVLFVPPTLPAKLQGDALEEVALFRDEMANMAWAVERTVQGAAGQPLNRYDEARAPGVHRSVDGAGVTAEIIYRLATPVPRNWLALVPVPAPVRASPGPGDFAIRLQRRVVEHTQPDGGKLRAEPRGALLRVDASVPVEQDVLWLEEEEVPRAGAVVRRAFQCSRWLGGTRHLWVGRAKHAGRGEGSSGLRYDVLEQRS